MGQIFWSLVPFIVLQILFVDARFFRRKTEIEDPETVTAPCPEGHPLFPFTRLFNDIPHKWKVDNDLILQDVNQKDSVICWTRKITIETDTDGHIINKFSSYEISFGIPKNYKQNYAQQIHFEDENEDTAEYSPIEEITTKEDITTKNVIFIKCHKKYVDARKFTAAIFPKMESINPNTQDISESSISTEEEDDDDDDLDFLNDIDICDNNFDVDILDSLPEDEETTTEEGHQTRKKGEDDVEFITELYEPLEENDSSIEFSSVPPLTTVTEETNLNIQNQTDKAEEMTTSSSKFTTELNTIINVVLGEMVNRSGVSEPPTTFHEFSFKSSLFKENQTEPEMITDIASTTESQSDEPVARKISHFENYHIPIQFRHLGPLNSKPKCNLIGNKIKYGKCSKPTKPVRILAESYLPPQAILELVDSLESNKEEDEILINGRKDCYLFKKGGNTDCPASGVNLTTVLEINDIPENQNDDPYFTIDLENTCISVNKHVTVIECPSYKNTLPLVKSENLPRNVRYIHIQNEIAVDTDDIIVHSVSHCLLLKKIKEIECTGKPDIVLKATEPTVFVDRMGLTTISDDDEDSLPTLRIGDYSVDQLDNSDSDSTETSESFDSILSTTPCSSNETEEFNEEPNSSTTITLPDFSTEESNSEKTTTDTTNIADECKDNDLDCIKRQNTRKTLSPPSKIDLSEEHVETTHQLPSTTTSKPSTKKPKIIEIEIPKSRKLSNSIKTKVEKSTHIRQIAFKPYNFEFIVKVACLHGYPYTCLSVSKYILQPTHNASNNFNYIVDKYQFPDDVKYVHVDNLEEFEEREKLYATFGGHNFILLKKQRVNCPKESILVLNLGNCSSETSEWIDSSEELPETKFMGSTIVKYLKGSKVYCLDFDEELRLHQIKCPMDLSNIPVLTRPYDLKSICRTQLKNKGHNEQMNVLRRLNIISDYN